jgi:hypothetical protein
MDDDIFISSGASCDTITLDDLSTDINLNTMAGAVGSIGAYTYSTASGSLSYGNYANGNITISTIGSSGSFLTSGANGTSWSTLGSTPQSRLQVNGDANFDGDLKIKGVSIANTLETINKRLSILVPDPAKLEHFAALKKAYEHYKTLEALCELPKEDTSE